MKKRLLSLLMVLAMLATLLPAGFVTVSAAETKTIVCVGDSLTAGSGSSNGQTYPVQLQNLLGSNYNVINAGLGGRTMGEYTNGNGEGVQYTYGDDVNGDKKPTEGEEYYGNGAALQVTKSTIASADIVIIMLGTNDAGYWVGDGKTADETDIANFTNAYTQMITIFQQWNPNLKFILATNPASCHLNDNAGWGNNTLTAVANQTKALYNQYADKDNFQLIDINTLTATWGDDHPATNVVSTSTDPWYVDTVHFNNTGYGKLAELYYEEFWDTRVHSVAVEGKDYQIEVDNELDTIYVVTEESLAGKTATIKVAANSTVNDSGSNTTTVTLGTDTTVTVTAPDGNTRTYTVMVAGEEVLGEDTLIYTAEQLAKLRGKTLSGSYKLMADIDMKDVAWTPIANLTGTFDGNGKTIKNLTINATANHQGLFAYITGGTAKDITLSDVNITATNQFVGGIAGQMKDGTITDCHVTSGSITINSGFAATAVQTLRVGGIVGGIGANSNGIIIVEKCSNAASITINQADNVTGNQDVHVGGVVGVAENYCAEGSVIRYCSNTGTIMGDDTSKKMGGVAGEAWIPVVNCWNTGAVTAYSDVGGVVGATYEGAVQMYLANCYNTGVVTAASNQNRKGGITARLPGGDIYNCYSTSALGTYAEKGSGTAENVFYLDAATASKNGTAKTEAAMKKANFVQELNNFVISKKDDAALGALGMTKWQHAENSYPVLTQDLPTDTDEVKDSFLITNAKEFLEMSGSGKYELNNDITITSTDVTGTANYLITSAFSGELDGAGYTVTIADGVNKGIFTNLAAGGVVKNLNVVANIDLSAQNNIASIAQDCYGTVDGCTFTGSVIGLSTVGGIVARLQSGGVVQNCQTKLTSSTLTAMATGGNANLGGIAGTVYGTSDAPVVIRNCVNEASLTTGSRDFSGGIAGYVDNNSYAIIDGCVNKGTMNTANQTGGIVGGNINYAGGDKTLIVVNCRNEGAVTGKAYVGGIVAQAQFGMKLYVINCYNVGTLATTDPRKGSIVGCIRTTGTTAHIYNCYSTMNWSVYLHQDNSATISAGSCYAPATAVAGATNTTVDTMKTLNFALQMNSYEADETVQAVLDANNITLKNWVSATDSTPVLGDKVIGTGGKLEYDNGVLLIDGENTLLYFASNPSTDARLTADITLTKDWTTITTAYTGTFDGDGHTISGFKQIDLANGNVGMFKELAAAGVIKNLTLSGHIDCPSASGFGAIVTTNNGLVYGCTNKVNIVDEDIARDEAGNLTIAGGKEKIGGVVGINNGTVDSCVNEGIVTALKDFVGGVVGFSSAGSLIVNCSNSGEVAHVPASGSDVGSGTGGILGGAPASSTASETACVVNCFNTGYVYDNNSHRGYLGGIVGDRGIAYNCYNTGKIWYKGNTGGGFGISGRQFAGVVESCYTSYNNNNDKNNGTIMTLNDMQTTDFATTLNNGVTTIPDSIKTALGDVTLRRWRYVEGDTPILSDGVIVTATGNYGETLLNVVVGSADELETVMATVKIPALGGYLFAGWNEPTDADAFAMAYESLTQEIALTPIYEVDEDGDKYTVTATNATANVTKGTFDTRVEVTAADGYKGNVAYWLLDGAKVGFGADSYTFYISGNSTIVAVSKDKAAEIVPEVVLQQATYSTNGETYTLSAIAQTSIPDGATVKSYGVYYTASVSALTALKAGTAVEGTYVQVESSKTDANQQYMTHLLGVASDKTRYAMAYAVLDDAVIYSSVVVQFKTTANTVNIVKGAI